MTDGYDPACGNCGHLYSDHYETDDELQQQVFNYKNELVEDLLNYDEHFPSGGEGIQYNADGTVSHACDCTHGKTQKEKLRNQCECEGFSDEPYEPELEWDNDD